MASGKWRRRRWGSGPRVMRRWEGPELGEPLPIFVAIQRLRCSSFRRSLVVFVHSFFFFYFVARDSQNPTLIQNKRVPVCSGF